LAYFFIVSASRMRRVGIDQLAMAATIARGAIGDSFSIRFIIFSDRAIGQHLVKDAPDRFGLREMLIALRVDPQLAGARSCRTASAPPLAFPSPVDACTACRGS
jgi:hypothetical protein